MEAAAAVIALITFSLQSTKFVYQTIEDIRDGPDVVRQLRERARSLEELLQQLLDLVQHSRQSAQAQDPDIWKPLEQDISQCSDYLQRTADKLKTLDSGKSKHRLKRTWNQVKISLKENDLARISDRVQHHVVELGLQLNIINSRLAISRTICESQYFEGIQASLRDTTAELSRQSTNFKEHVSENAKEVDLSLTKLTTAVQDSDRRQGQLNDQTHDALKNNGQIVVDRINENHKRLGQDAQEMTQSIASRLDKLQNMSAEQFEIIIDRLRQVERQGSLNCDLINTDRADGQLPQGVQDAAEAVEGSQGESILSAAIDRLCLLTSSTAKVCYSEDAEEIIEDLGCVLDAILHEEIGVTDQIPKVGKRKRCDENPSRNIHRDIKKVRGLLSASQAIEIGESYSARHVLRSKSGQKPSKNSAEVYCMADCTAVVSFRTYFDTRSKQQGELERVSMQNTHNTHRGSINILPRTGIGKAKISACFVQQFTSLGFHSLNPIISFHPVIPDEADIFRAVEAGDVDWMLELINTSKASLRDCDSHGRSLLNFAISRQQLAPCRFLVNHGADVDSLEQKFEMGKTFAPPLNQQRFNDDDIEENDELQTCLAIRQCLLEHDADPNSPMIDGSTRSILKDILIRSPTEFIKLTLKYGANYIDLKARDEDGRDSFLQMLCNLSSYASRKEIFQKVKLLLSYGAEIGTRDVFNRGCLHALVCYPHNIYARSLKQFKNFRQTVISILSTLIRMGADIYAVDIRGISVTELAHSYRNGRLWEEALKDCGLEVEHVYVKDYGIGTWVSDDIYAPRHDQPRQAGTFDIDYYDKRMQTYVRDALMSERLGDTENACSSIHELSYSDLLRDYHEPERLGESTVKDDDDNDEAWLSFDERILVPGNKRSDDDVEYSGSDEEMGGVSLIM